MMRDDLLIPKSIALPCQVAWCPSIDAFKAGSKCWVPGAREARRLDLVRKMPGDPGRYEVADPGDAETRVITWSDVMVRPPRFFPGDGGLIEESEGGDSVAEARRATIGRSSTRTQTPQKRNTSTA